MLFHEAPHKLRATLSDLASAFGDTRRIAICRELTKLNEEVLRLTLGGAVSYYEKTEPRGEYVLVVEGASDAPAEEFWQDMDVSAHLAHYMNNGLSKMDAIKQVARDRCVPKNQIYQLTIED